MEKIKNLLEGNTVADMRSALYYLGRYIKQADSFETYEKDIFEDSLESTPSEFVIQLTLKLIEAVESIANKKASKFNEEEFYFWMDKISEMEDKIDPSVSDAEIQKALSEISQFTFPNGNTNNNAR